ncbi:TonB-dependent receptor [Sphingomonas sp. BIUV-7]|uniref:TonB-dependent receptor n=1 Tax=Sphingomonas natans TaxID=3063330 RepID=A0ABT8YA95_9SPHN|nr:TonB-dependent receptor [Sphingomonas sp. BIUV-7]MDO6415262.1 TonB-dependent receptor [Sphingomonas sp. BIUV-7]
MRSTAKLYLCGVAICVTMPSAVHAQQDPRPMSESVSQTTGAADATDTTVGEIIVTAQKRSENVRDIPISIVALDQSRLQDSRVTNIVALQTVVSGLAFATNREGTPAYAIRGVSSNVGVESGVAVHLDGTYLGSKPDQSIPFYDVARVEVLRGPQGTLYGRNATGGSINIITNDPTSEPMADVQATFGNYRLAEAQGAVSGPIAGDNLLGRIAFKTTSLPGYGRNLSNNSRVNGARTTSIRAKLAWEPSNNLKVLLSGDYTDTYSTFVDQLTAIFPTPVVRGGRTIGGELTTNLLAPILGPEYREALGYDSNRNLPNDRESRTGGGALRITWDADWAILTSSTSYRAANNHDRNDFIGTKSDAAYYKYNDFKQQQFSQELNLNSAASSKLKWTTGLFYYNVHRTSHYQAPLDTSVDAVLGLPTIKADFQTAVPKYETNSYAIYGQASYPLLERLSLTVGGRYSKERVFDSEWQFITPLVPYSSFEKKAHFNAFTPKAALEWKVSSELNVYATASRGFKSGGFSPGSFVSQGFAPEHVNNYELGAKASLAGGRMRFNAAVFQMDYTNLQVNTNILSAGGTPQLLVTNAAKARIRGVEGDYALRLTPWFSVDGNATYLDAKYLEFLAAYGLGIVGFNIDAAGNRLPGAPAFSANLGANIKIPLGDWTADLRGEFNHQSRIYYTAFENLDGISRPAANVENASLHFASPNSGWSSTLWIRNIGNKRIISNTQENYDNVLYTGYFRSTTFQPPRTFGLTVERKF